jgi:hypothetical protein
LRILSGHQRVVSSAAFSADGTRIVTASWDGTARLWEVPEIFRVDARAQVKMACAQLAERGLPLAFTAEDLAAYPVLEGQPRDPETGDFLSPCRGVLPDAVIAENYARRARRNAKPAEVAEK